MFMSLDCAVLTKPYVEFYPSSYYDLTLSIRSYLNLWFLFIACTIFEDKLNKYGEGSDCTSFLFFVGEIFRKIKRRHRRCNSLIKKFLKFFSDGLVVFLFCLNISLIIICNPSLLNPGPKSFSIFYNNVQGFFNTRDLASDSPPLNMAKIHEVHGYIYSTKPDIIILNETWLKSSICDNEILPDNYKVFRRDRSSKSHPLDANRPKKFRKFGGGVMIAHRRDLAITSVQFTKISVQAELLSVIFKTASGNKNLCIELLSCWNTGTRKFS